jgi:hypothetical protein
MAKTKRVTINAKAVDYLDEMAAAEGVSKKVYLEALMNYAISCYRRPGSWEANRPFEFSTYDDRLGEDIFADRWFGGEK